jgi:hypothetical protein
MGAGAAEKALPSWIKVVGPIFRVSQEGLAAGPTTRNGRKRVLVIGEPGINMGRLKDFLRELLNTGEFEVVYRRRPDGKTVEIERALSEWAPAIQISQRVTLDEDVRDVDLCIGGLSGALFECYLSGVPSLFLGGLHAVPPVVGEWAVIAVEPADLREKVATVLSWSPEKIGEIREYLWGEGGSGISRIVDDLPRETRPTRSPNDPPRGL